VNILAKNALVGIIKILISKEMWEKVKKAVEDVSGNANITGEEKRAIVIAAIKESGWAFATALLHLTIEIAVVVMTGKLAELEKK